jgi:hypothetical protein
MEKKNSHSHEHCHSQHERTETVDVAIWLSRGKKMETPKVHKYAVQHDESSASDQE